MTEATRFLLERNWPSVDGRWYEGLRQVQLRDGFIAKFGFAILNEETIEAIRPYAPLVEIGAGSGYWAYELKNAGVDVVPTDPGTGKYQSAERWEPYLPIERCTGTQAVRRYPERNLLTVWPDYNRSWAVSALRAFKGDVVLYVGEGDGGCTADYAFHRYLQRHFTTEAFVEIPQFEMIHDRLQILRRRK